MAVGCSSTGGVEAPDSGPTSAGGAAGGSGGDAGQGGSGDAGQGGSGVSLGGNGGGGQAGSEGKFDGCYNVDVLFVIDNSGSMSDKQAALIEAFPKFAETMKQKLSGAVTYHIGVVTSDDSYDNVAGCEPIGSLIVQTSGINSSNKNCGPFSSGKNYIDGADPQLAERFACAAQVGSTGSDNERVMRSLLNAANPSSNAAGKCNEGFLRPDSLLIVVILADEDDAPDDGCDPFGGLCMTGSGGKSADWYDELVGYRGGVADNVVALGLVKSGNCAGSIGARLEGFTLKFKNSAVGDICTLDYGQFFDDALPLIGNACAKYTPIK